MLFSMLNSTVFHTSEIKIRHRFSYCYGILVISVGHVGGKELKAPQMKNSRKKATENSFVCAKYTTVTPG